MTRATIPGWARDAYGLDAQEPIGIVVGLTGERLQVRADGSVEEILRSPSRRWSVSAVPTHRSAR